MHSPPPESVLNEHQHRHFEVLLAMFHDTLAEIEQLAAPAPAAGPDGLTVFENDLPAGFADAIRPELQAMRAIAARLATQLQLRPRVISRTRAIQARLTSEMVRLEDSTAAKLGGYGAVDQRVEREVDPVLRELHAHLHAVSRRLGRTGRPVPGARVGEHASGEHASGGHASGGHTSGEHA